MVHPADDLHRRVVVVVISIDQSDENTCIDDSNRHHLRSLKTGSSSWPPRSCVSDPSPAIDTGSKSSKAPYRCLTISIERVPSSSTSYRSLSPPSMSSRPWRDAGTVTIPRSLTVVSSGAASVAMPHSIGPCVIHAAPHVVMAVSLCSRGDSRGQKSSRRAFTCFGTDEGGYDCRSAG